MVHLRGHHRGQYKGIGLQVLQRQAHPTLATLETCCDEYTSGIVCEPSQLHQMSMTFWKDRISGISAWHGCLCCRSCVPEATVPAILWTCLAVLSIPVNSTSAPTARRARRSVPSTLQHFECWDLGGYSNGIENDKMSHGPAGVCVSDRNLHFYHPDPCHVPAPHFYLLLPG